MSGVVLKWTQRLLFAVAFAALGYCAFVMTDSWIYQRRANAELNALTPQALSPGTPVLPGDDQKEPVAGAKAWHIEPHEMVGRIEVKRLGLSVMVMEGTSATMLARAAGHIEGTALPGGPGNVGIAAHRDTFFRPLRNIRKDDVITVTTPSGSYSYRVVSTSVVSPDDVAVLDSDGTDVLTLVTCYPFNFIGSAPNRFIVRAEQVGTPMQPGDQPAHRIL